MGHNNPPASPLMEEVAKLAALGEVSLLEEARRHAIRLLLAKLRLGEISAPELAVLRNLLRDNGLVMGFDQPPSPEEEATRGAIGFHLPDPDYSEDIEE